MNVLKSVVTHDTRARVRTAHSCTVIVGGISIVDTGIRYLIAFDVYKILPAVQYFLQSPKTPYLGDYQATNVRLVLSLPVNCVTCIAFSQKNKTKLKSCTIALGSGVVAVIHGVFAKTGSRRTTVHRYFRISKIPPALSCTRPALRHITHARVARKRKRSMHARSNVVQLRRSGKSN